MLGPLHPREHVLEIDRPDRQILLGAVRIVWRKPDRPAIADLRGVVLLSERMALHLHDTPGRALAGKRRNNVVLHILPIAVEHLRHVGIIEHEGIVRLAAYARRRPVGAAGHYGLGLALRVAVDGKLVVADVVVVEQPARQLNSGVAQSFAVWRIAGVPETCVRVPPRVRKDDFDIVLGVDDGIAQDIIAEFVEGEPHLPALSPRTSEQARQHVWNLAMQIGADLAVRAPQLGLYRKQCSPARFQRFREHATSTGWKARRW